MGVITYVSTKIGGLLAVANRCKTVRVSCEGHAEFWELLVAAAGRDIAGSVKAVWASSKPVFICDTRTEGVNTVSGQNGNCVDRKAESKLSAVSYVAEVLQYKQHRHDSARSKTICS
jgi:hypothetical protein